MFAAISILAFAFIAMAQDTAPGTLVPIDQGVTDRSATATSLRIQPVELSQSTNFQKLFGIAGRPDLFVRSQGGLFAVFDQGSYRKVQGRTFIQWPAGTVYYIGQPNFYTLRGTGIRMSQSGSNPPPGIALRKKVSGPDMRIGAQPENNFIQSIPLESRLENTPVTDRTPVRVPIKDIGFGHSSALPALPQAVPAEPQTSSAQQSSSQQQTPSSKNATAPTPVPTPVKP